MRARWTLVAAVLLLGAALVWVGGGGLPLGGEARDRSAAPREERETRPPSLRGPERSLSPAHGRAAPHAHPAWDGVLRALGASSVEAARLAATDLRGRILAGEVPWSDVRGVLLAPSTPTDLRRALAFVVGTLARPEADDLLLELLEAFAGDPEVARDALLALGAWRAGEGEEEVFDMGERPWGAAGAGGLGITVRREVGDPDVRAALLRHLRTSEPLLREAAARALRHSLSDDGVRAAFADAVEREGADDVAAPVAEALAARLDTLADAERSRVGALLLRRAGEEGMDGLRFRMEDDLAAARLTDEERDALRGLARPGATFAVRSFALTVLATQAPRDGDVAVARARGLLHETLAAERDRALRALAARLLGRLPWTEGTAAALGAALGDAEWSVRAGAVHALSQYRERPEAKALLAQAARDPDARVADAARRAAAEAR